MKETVQGEAMAVVSITGMLEDSALEEGITLPPEFDDAMEEATSDNTDEIP